MATAWLIGAGFSWEFGMPLVWELTKELRALITPSQLREVNASVRQSHGYPAALIDEFAPVLERADLHYEQIIGWLQAESLRRHADRPHLQKLTGALQAVVGGLLLSNHAKYDRLFPLVLPYPVAEDLTGSRVPGERGHARWRRGSGLVARVLTTVSR